jgi:putative transposase
LLILEQGDESAPVEEICSKSEGQPSHIFNWKKKYAGVLPVEMQWFRA